MNDDNKDEAVQKIVDQPVVDVTAKKDDESLDGRLQQLTDDEWDQVEKLTGQSQSDGTVLTRDEAIDQVLAGRK